LRCRFCKPFRIANSCAPDEIAGRLVVVGWWDVDQG
jgi:hypothetical protein